jgi:hypothetical protein
MNTDRERALKAMGTSFMRVTLASKGIDDTLYFFLYLWQDTGEMGTLWELDCASIGNILWHWCFPVLCVI